MFKKIKRMWMNYRIDTLKKELVELKEDIERGGYYHFGLSNHRRFFNTLEELRDCLKLDKLKTDLIFINLRGTGALTKHVFDGRLSLKNELNELKKKYIDVKQNAYSGVTLGGTYNLESYLFDHEYCTQYPTDHINRARKALLDLNEAIVYDYSDKYKTVFNMANTSLINLINCYLAIIDIVTEHSDDTK